MNPTRQEAGWQKWFENRPRKPGCKKNILSPWPGVASQPVEAHIPYQIYPRKE